MNTKTHEHSNPSAFYVKLFTFNILNLNVYIHYVKLFILNMIYLNILNFKYILIYWIYLKCLYDQMRLYIYRISVTRRHEKVKTDSNLSFLLLSYCRLKISNFNGKKFIKPRRLKTGNYYVTIGTHISLSKSV